MNEKVGLLDRYLLTNKKRLKSGEVLTVKLNDGVLTIYNEQNEKTGDEKTVTFIDRFDEQLDLAIGDLIY